MTDDVVCRVPEPFHKYPGLHCVDDAAELGLLVRAAARKSGSLSEGGGQPIGDLRGHAVRVQLLEVVLRV